uniref:GB1/RHD3-type G domain-containing protein n=1 Tax=Spermophilus dauricus TaxID=99837 RepID=A0A8C9UWB2_SPEDA
MTSETYMPGPMCLIENMEGQLVVSQEALKILSSITQPMVVVAILGICSTSKSYLMNQLAGKKKGFSVGSTVQSHTKGIWMWCVPHPEKPGHTLVLLDTEGLGDVEKNDTQIFALAILLSSTFVYNDQGTIDLLHYVTELTDLLRARTSPDIGVGDADGNVSFFPDLVWILRDFYLSLEIDGQLMTADEYLENSVKTKQDNWTLVLGKKHKLSNLPQLCIQEFFPTKKCFVFDPPTHQKKVSQLETLQDVKFSSHIFTKSKIKTILGGIRVNGPRLESLVLTYVNTINSGNLPCLENTVLALALAQRENAALMGQKVQLPTETLQELLDLHRAGEREAIKIFTENSFKDEDQSFQKELKILLDTKQKDICKQNKEASLDHCSTLLQDIFGPEEEAVKQEVYSKPGGHNLYLQKTEELKAKYHQQTRKGIQLSLAKKALRKYLKSKESVTNAVLLTDKALTAKEKEMEGEKRIETK